MRKLDEVHFLQPLKCCTLTFGRCPTHCPPRVTTSRWRRCTRSRGAGAARGEGGDEDGGEGEGEEQQRLSSCTASTSLPPRPLPHSGPAPSFPRPRPLHTAGPAADPVMNDFPEQVLISRAAP